jgi:hypothetical protein
MQSKIKFPAISAICNLIAIDAKIKTKATFSTSKPKSHIEKAAF